MRFEIKYKCDFCKTVWNEKSDNLINSICHCSGSPSTVFPVEWHDSKEEKHTTIQKYCKTRTHRAINADEYRMLVKFLVDQYRDLLESDDSFMLSEIRDNSGIDDKEAFQNFDTPSSEIYMDVNLTVKKKNREILIEWSRDNCTN